MIRLTVPSLDEVDFAAVREVLESGYLVQGPRVAEFERQIAERVGTEHAVAVANCTAALHLSLLAVGVSRGDRVAVPAYSWPATANVIALCEAEPVFVDIQPRTYSLDPRSLEQALSEAPVKVVLPVHAFGGLAEMPEIVRLAREHGAVVVEDAACALGAELDGRPAGAWGVLGCFSFHPRKAITTGEGGVVTTNDAALARRLRILRNHGQDPDASTPDFVEPGYNVRMTEFQAALGTTQLAKLERIITRRRELAARYDRLLAAIGVLPPRAVPGSVHVYQSYVARLPEGLAKHRPAILSALRAQGIEATIGTYHIPLTRYFRDRWNFAPGDFPATDDAASHAISLPLFESMTEEDQDRVVELLAGLVTSLR